MGPLRFSYPCFFSTQAADPMTQTLFLADIAGQVTRAASANPRVTCGALAIDPNDASHLRAAFGGLPKWGRADEYAVQYVTELLKRYAISMVARSWTCDNAQWQAFWDDSKRLCQVMAQQDGRRVGFAQPATVTRLTLFGEAIAVTAAHAVKLGRRSSVFERGMELHEQFIILDSDLAGQETLEFARGLFLDRSHLKKTERAGLLFRPMDLKVVTEVEEPLLLLADYLAGIVHRFLIPNGGRIVFPIDHIAAAEAVLKLGNDRKLVVKDTRFDLSCSEIYPDLG